MSIPFDIVEPYPGWAQDSRAPLILGVMGPMTSLAILFGIARIYSRLISLKRIGVDDYTIIASIILLLTYMVLVAVAISYGAGRHQQTLSPENAQRARFYIWISFLPGIASFAMPKFAVVILLAKILDPSTLHRAIMWVLSVTYALLTVGMLVMLMVQCHPTAVLWGAAEGSCWDFSIIVRYGVAHGVYTALFDFYLALYPTIVLSLLQLGWRKKLAFSSSLGFGYCAGAVAAYKAYTLSKPPDPSDFTYFADRIIIWTNIEASCVIIGACIPCLFPLVKKVFGVSALSGGTGKQDDNQRGGSNKAIITIGSPLRGIRRVPRSPFGLSEFDTITDDSKPDVLELSIHASTTELRVDDILAELERQQQNQEQGSQLQQGE